MGGHQGDAARLFTVVRGGRARGNEAGAEIREAQSGDKEETLMITIIKQWNEQPRKIEISVPGGFQTRLDKTLSVLILLSEGRLNRDLSWSTPAYMIQRF